MPTYEYRCKECGYEFDQHQSFSEPRLTDCPSCQTAGALRKVFGNVGVTFKGSGFYRTDSRSSDSSTLSENGSQNGAKSSESTSESKSESKPKSESASGSAAASDSKAA
ncbi:FmdB family zinc ribbon protein [Glycomyces xiaoerkulensis]|uniref:FmdB family zinc ribbon protein n=1 Tax=Glycomyces xiaoerkulensis TaxID=2038139 RepID=UPI000C26748C|nr:zinc ribbon domain-containing protein [Glycomyces xiaoerkulensis]